MIAQEASFGQVLREMEGIDLNEEISTRGEECDEIYGNPMCVLEHLSYPVLIASHIKPFIDSDDNEAYDPNNGLLLSRTIDSLFDLKYNSIYCVYLCVSCKAKKHPN